MKKLKMILVLALCVPQVAQAVAIGANGGKKSVSRMNDASGNPVLFSDDKPWKVFEVFGTATIAQLVDESSVAPKQGMIKRVCVESGISASSIPNFALIFDSAVAADTSLVLGGRRLAPPLTVLSLTSQCWEINALFTSGAAVKNNTATGSTYVYWRELGGYR